MQDDDIEKFLQNFENTERKKEDENVPIPTERVEDYISEKLNKLTNLSIESIEEVKDLAVASNDGETISALASLITAASKQLELLSKFALQKEKIKSTEKMQDKDHAHKEKIVERKHEQLKELNGGGSDAPRLQQNNIYISASREEIMDRLLGDIKSKVDQKRIIDTEV